MIRGTNTYDVFVRDWWRDAGPEDRGHIPGERIPYLGAPRTYIARGVSCDEARDLCAEYRANHEPGRYSRKAEFEEA